MSSSENSSSNPFKDRFENWEGPVRPDFWNDMERNLDVPTMKQGIWWWISGIIMLGGIGAGVWYNSGSENTKTMHDVRTSLVQSEKPAVEKSLPAAAGNTASPHPESSWKTGSAPKQNAQSPESERPVKQEAAVQSGPLPESGPSANPTVPFEKDRQPSQAKAIVLTGVAGLPSLGERGTQNRVKTRPEIQTLAASGRNNAKQRRPEKSKSQPILISGIRENGETAAAASHSEPEIPARQIDIIREKEGQPVLSIDAPVAETPPAIQDEGNQLNQFPLKEDIEQMKAASVEQPAGGSGKPNLTDSVQVADQKTMPLQIDSSQKPGSADSSHIRKRLTFWAGVSVNGISRQMKLFRSPEEFFGKESRGVQQFRTSPLAGLHVTGNMDCLPWLALRLDVTAMAWVETIEYRIEAGQSAERAYNNDQQDSTIMLVQPRNVPRKEVSTSWNGLLGMMPELDFHAEKGSYGLRLGNRFQWIIRNPPDSRFKVWNPGLAFYRKYKKWDGEVRMHFSSQAEKSPRILPKARAEIRQILWGFTLRRSL